MAEQAGRRSRDRVNQHRRREQVVCVQPQDGDGDAGDDARRPAARQVHVRPERTADGDEPFDRHGD